MTSFFDKIGEAKLAELARQAADEAIQETHAAGLAACGMIDGKLGLLFPDQSTRLLPDNLPQQWLHIWADLQHRLFHALSPNEWQALHVEYQNHGGRLHVSIGEGTPAETAAKVEALAAQYADVDPTDYPKELKQKSTS